MKCWNPECANELSPRASRCPLCGWDKPKPAGKGAADPTWWQCADVDQFGQRCSKAGAISHGTHGGGPWYCQQHAFPERGKAAVAPPKGFRALRQLTSLVSPTQREPGEEG